MLFSIEKTGLYRVNLRS